jgi:hypothetical protein
VPVEGVNYVHRYTELASGMNYTNVYGQLVESKEQVTILPQGGAAAVQGQHKVYFPGDIYNGVIEVVTPDGKHLRSRPLGVSYDDGSNTIFIATLKHSIGYLVSSNKVVYRDAFSGIKADLVCTYRRGGFESDLVFRQQPPAPGDYGLDPNWSTLQLVTEFFNTPDPQEMPAANDEWYGLQDSTLKFGKLTMKQGKAFAFNETNGVSRAGSVPVYKRWLKLDGRKFLVEEVPVVDMAEDLEALPLQSSIQRPESKIKYASNHPSFPPSHGIMACTNQILLAAAGFNKEPGYVLDYSEVDSDQDFTFQAGQTYYIANPCSFSGTVTIEGGAVIKLNYDGYLNNGEIDIYSNIVCNTSADHPAVLTSVNDNSVGELIGSGDPHYWDVQDFLCLDSSIPVNVHHLRFSYCMQAMVTWPSPDVDIWDCQFYMTMEAFAGNGLNLGLHNVLIDQGTIDGCDDAIYMNQTGAVMGENVTYRSENSFLIAADDGIPVGLTNCLVAGGLVDYGSAATNHVAVVAWDAAVFQAAANANYYLVTNSPYRNVGTTNINPDLLAALRTMTTYAPQDGGYPDINTDHVDLGYHYPVNEDSDYDSLPDWWEWKYFGSFTLSGTNLDGQGNTLGYDYINGTDPLNPFSNTQVRLGYWPFDNTNNWVGSAGQLPLLATNVVGVPSWNTNGVQIDTTNVAILKYRDVETNGNANINLQKGTICFLFKPDWSSGDQGGTGPQAEGRLIELGAKGTTNGWWGLVIDPSGENICFGTQTNSTGTLNTNLTAQISWTSNTWHWVVMTYSSSNSSFYLDGQPASTNGIGITNIPGLVVRNKGFTIGSSASGTNQVKGVFDELGTFNYPMSQADALDINSDGIPDWSAMSMDLSPLANIADLPSASGDGLSNLKEYQKSLQPFSLFVATPQNAALQ